MGTVAEIQDEDNTFFLTATTEFDCNNHVIYEPELYFSTLQTLLRYIDTHNNYRPVFIPIIGSGQAGLGLKKKEILQAMIDSFSFCPHYNTPKGTYIMIHKSDRKELPLRLIQFANNNYINI